MLSKKIKTNVQGVVPFRVGDLPKVRGLQRGFLFIDYDGTLAPIVSHPDRAKIPASIRRALQQAARTPRWTVGIVSGRLLKDVRQRVDLPNLVYAGNHGLEIEFPSQPRFVHPAAVTARPLIHAIYDRVRRETSKLRGVLVEDKIYTLSLHTRLARPSDERRAHQALMHAARVPLSRKQIVIRRGKKVLEVRPAAPWDKGKAVQTILETAPPPVLIVYVGDDNTDEDAFRALRTGAITIRVGKGETSARYYIPSVAEMPKTITAVVGLLNGG